MDILHIYDLYKRFNDKDVLKGLNLTVPERSIYGFIGKNGAGKTTTMKTILGLIKADAGEIMAGGEKVVYGQTETNRHIGYLPDVPEFYSFMNAQELGLNTCWVAMTHGKSKAVIGKGEKQVCLIALGYGCTNGIAHRSKALSEVCRVQGEMPEWFLTGMEAALLAPTATNQQKFFFELLPDGKVKASARRGFYTKLDLGIVKYHFEALAGDVFVRN